MADLSETKVKLLTEIFQILDRDGSGTISIPEFKRLGEAMYEVRTGKKAISLSTETVRQQLMMADTDGDLELTLKEYLDFSNKLQKMDDAAFVKSFTAYKSALLNRAEGDISKQGPGGSIRVKAEVKRINKITSADVEKAEVKRLDTQSVDPSAKQTLRERKTSSAAKSEAVVQANTNDAQELAVGKVATRVGGRTIKTRESDNAAEEVVEVQKTGVHRGR
eukprot:INCI10837.2.p1 GENE.INCI10837.2~~INCI10837.2.p1  ORF type:complete len:221 (+),score=48.27 INCI10837.2:266-928(+)